MEDQIRIETVQCRRGCGRSVSVLSRSPLGLDDLHAKFSGICDDCLTPSELKVIDEAVIPNVISNSFQ